MVHLESWIAFTDSITFMYITNYFERNCYGFFLLWTIFSSFISIWVGKFSTFSQNFACDNFSEYSHERNIIRYKNTTQHNKCVESLMNNTNKTTATCFIKVPQCIQKCTFICSNPGCRGIILCANESTVTVWNLVAVVVRK